jgi:EAL domain-containing protein (putative c-di-GMP-specific phosphodiesterase class I)
MTTDTGGAAEGEGALDGQLSPGDRVRQALEERHFVLHYQPMLDLASVWHLRRAGHQELGGSMVGVEALIRLEDQVEGLLHPGEFISLAEDAGLIVMMGDWTTEEVCRQSSAWTEAGLELDVAFNLSLRQLWAESLVPRIRESVAAYGVDPGKLIVETSEAAAMADPARTEAILKQIAECGLQVAIDDFGTGDSSLARLMRMPVNIVKIDRPFTSGLPDDSDSVTMVTTMIQLAENLGMRTLAEGIETEEQLRFLVDRGCELGQGFLFSRPVPAAQIATA